MIAEDIIRYTNNSAGFEKILKGSQGVFKILSSRSTASFFNASKDTRKGFGLATKHIGHGRRFVRFMWCMDAFLKLEESRKGEGESLLKFLITGKWACYSLFTFAEALKLFHAVGLPKTRYSRFLTRWAQKFWFFALCFSILAGITELAPHFLNPDYVPEHERHAERERERERHGSHGSIPPPPYGRVSPTIASSSRGGAIDPEMERRKLFVDGAKTKGKNVEHVKTSDVICELFADVFDMVIPASNIGWIKPGSEAVGAAFFMTSALSGKVIWDRVNS